MSELQKVPALPQRPETGPMQFGDDWPGIFIRGDNAMAYAMMLRSQHEMYKSAVKTLAVLLESCNARNFPPTESPKEDTDASSAADKTPPQPAPEPAGAIEKWMREPDHDGRDWNLAYLCEWLNRRPLAELARLRSAPPVTEEMERMRAALIEIRDHWANQYDHPRKQAPMYEGSYGIGVTDGHRAAAIIARAALTPPSGTDEQK